MRRDLLARPELPRAGAELRRLADRRNVDFAAAAERRSWLEQLLGRQPAGLAGPLSAAQERAGAHVERALGVAAEQRPRRRRARARGARRQPHRRPARVLGRARHALGAALERPQHRPERAARPARHASPGSSSAACSSCWSAPTPRVLWVLLPLAVLLAGLAPAAISFAAGQAAFTLTLLILFNILAPEGWQIGLVRIEDVALGSAVSLAVGLLFWPRGAAAALGKALAEAYADSADYLAGAVRFGIGRCDAVAPPAPAPTDEAVARRRGLAAARRHLPQLSRRARRQARAARRGDQPGHRRRRACGSRATPCSTCGSGDGARRRRPGRGPAELLASTEQMTRLVRRLRREPHRRRRGARAARRHDQPPTPGSSTP